MSKNARIPQCDPHRDEPVFDERSLRITRLEHIVTQLMARIQELESSKGIVKPFDLEPKR